MNFLFKIGFVFSISVLCSCSPFYTRHYTKGFYHEASVKKPHPGELSKAPETKVLCSSILKDTIKEKRNVKPLAFNEPNEVWATIEHKHFQKTGKKANSFSKSIAKKPLVSAKQVLQKKLRQGSASGNAQPGKALLYILAILLALAIIALAIYFLPAILIPAPVSSAFATLLIVAIIVVLVFFVLLLYSLFKHLISLFKHKKAVPEDDF